MQKVGMNIGNICISIYVYQYMYIIVLHFRGREVHGYQLIRSISKSKFDLGCQVQLEKDFLVEGFDRATHWRCSTCLHHVTLKWRLDSIFTRMFDLLMLLNIAHGVAGIMEYRRRGGDTEEGVGIAYE